MDTLDGKTLLLSIFGRLNPMGLQGPTVTKTTCVCDLAPLCARVSFQDYRYTCMYKSHPPYLSSMKTTNSNLKDPLKQQNYDLLWLRLFVNHALKVSSTSLPAMALSEALFGRKRQSGESRLRRAEQAYQKCRLCQGSKLVEKWGSPITASTALPPKSAAVNSCGDFSRTLTVRPLTSSN